LENDRVAAVADEADEIVVAPATIFAPLPPVVSPPGPAEDSDVHSGSIVLLSDVDFGDASTASTVASVLAAAAAGEPSPFTRSPVPESSPDVEPAPMQRPAARVDDGVAAHLVADTRVTPARPEPFMPRRRPEFPDDTPRPSITRIGGGGGGGACAAAAGLAVAEPTDQKSHIERDPSVNKSLLLRLIAGVRGL